MIKRKNEFVDSFLKKKIGDLNIHNFASQGLYVYVYSDKTRLKRLEG